MQVASSFPELLTRPWQTVSPAPHLWFDQARLVFSAGDYSVGIYLCRLATWSSGSWGEEVRWQLPRALEVFYSVPFSPLTFLRHMPSSASHVTCPGSALAIIIFLDH